MKTIRKLCTPAYVYLIMSIISMVLMMIQNAGNRDRFALGKFSNRVDSTATIFIAQGVYSLFWVFVLNAICKTGYRNVSWFLVVLPFILLFLGLEEIVFRREGFGAVKSVPCSDNVTQSSCETNAKVCEWAMEPNAGQAKKDGSTLALTGKCNEILKSEAKKSDKKK